MCFEKAFHLILMHFYFLFLMLWGVFSKISFFFSKKDVFPDFRLIQSVFRSIEILFKKFNEPLPGSIDRTCFLIDRTSCFKFFKNNALTDSNTFSKKFSNFSISLRLGKAAQRFFCHFLPKFLQGFSPSRLVRPFYPSFCSSFHVFMHFRGIFGPFQSWDFCWFNAIFLKLIIGFCWYIDIFIIVVG